MKSIKVLASLTMMLVLAIPAFAADVDGTWTGMITTPNGDLPVNFTFKAEGEKLTGSTMNFDGSQLNISDGKISGNDITFKLSFAFGGMPFVLNYKGVVSPTEIKIAATSELMPMPLELVLKKAPAAR